MFGTLANSLGGAISGVVLTLLAQHLTRFVKKLDPLEVKAARSSAPPSWFACPVQEIEPDDVHKFCWEVLSVGAFCGFAKFNVDVRNKSQDVVYIDNISISKRESNSRYNARVCFVPQGGSNAIRLVCNLDDGNSEFKTSLTQGSARSQGYFRQGSRIKIAPGETERIFLSFVAVRNAWLFNCALEYSLNGESRVIESILGENQEIVPYVPELVERNYTTFVHRAAPGDYKAIPDERYFTEQMRVKEVFRRHEAESALEYLQAQIDPH